MNRLLGKLLGQTTKGEQRVSLHAINDNDLPGSTFHNRRCGSILRKGRLNLNFWDDDERHNTITLGWAFGTWRCGSSITLHSPGGDDSVSGHWSIPGIYLYTSIDRLLPRWMEIVLGLYRPKTTDEKYNHYTDRTVGFSIHHGRLWVSLWENEMEWNCEDPWWWKFNVSLNPLDVLGQWQYASEIIREQAVEIPMPERAYKASVKMCADSWKRPRWPWWPLTRTILRAHVDDMEPIPFPGKGENSWDCGPDALRGITCAAQSPEAAVGEIVASVFRDRMRHGCSYRYEPNESANPS